MVKPILESPTLLRIGSERLTAPDVDRLIEVLARLRADMQPAVPLSFRAAAELDAVVDPHAAVGVAQLGHVFLALRDPGLGWRAFEFTTAEATRLRDYLVKQLPFAQVDQRGGEAH
jgi:hypothetical protein